MNTSATDPTRSFAFSHYLSRVDPQLSIFESITNAFQAVLANPTLSDVQIRRTHDPMELDTEISLIEAVPCYMLYCVKYPEEDSLVAYSTVNALAEYGRAKNSANNYLNFKFQCDDQQRKAVVEFLLWAKGAPCFEDEDQIERALKNWG